MKKIINVERLRSLFGKKNSKEIGQEEISEFERYLIQEGIKQILLDNHVNETMIKYLEDMQLINSNAVELGLKESSVNNEKKIKTSLKRGAPIKVLTWDKEGLIDNKDFFGTQRDWNQKLLSLIGEISTNIREIILKGDANSIIIHPKLMRLFEDMFQFRSGYQEFNGYCREGFLGEKYTITSALNVVEPDEIIVSRIEMNQDFSLEKNIFDHYGIIKVLNYS